MNWNSMSGLKKPDRKNGGIPPRLLGEEISKASGCQESLWIDIQGRARKGFCGDTPVITILMMVPTRAVSNHSWCEPMPVSCQMGIESCSKRIVTIPGSSDASWRAVSPWSRAQVVGYVRLFLKWLLTLTNQVGITLTFKLSSSSLCVIHDQRLTPDHGFTNNPRTA